MKGAYRAAVAAILVALGSASAAEDYQVVDLPPNEKVDVFFQVNTQGNVFVKLEAGTGEACADFWWIKWPLGKVEHLGRHCGFAKFAIPSGIMSATVSAKLRAGGASTPVRIGIAADESVAHSISLSTADEQPTKSRDPVVSIDGPKSICPSPGENGCGLP